MTMDVLASRMGISKGHLSDLETGKKPINSRRLADVARALGVKIAELLGDDEDIDDALVEEFRSLPPDLRREAIDFARFRSSRQGGGRKP